MPDHTALTPTRAERRRRSRMCQQVLAAVEEQFQQMERGERCAILILPHYDPSGPAVEVRGCATDGEQHRRIVVEGR